MRCIVHDELEIRLGNGQDSDGPGRQVHGEASTPGHAGGDWNDRDVVRIVADQLTTREHLERTRRGSCNLHGDILAGRAIVGQFDVVG